MKNIIRISAVLATVLLAASCYKAKYDEGADYFNFVTVVNEKADGSAYHFETDAGIILNPTTNKTTYKGRDGKRLVAYFSFDGNYKDGDKECDIKLFSVDTLVKIGNSVRIETNKNNELDSFGTDPLSVSLNPYGPTASEKYLNLYVGYNPDKRDKHNFSLVSIADEDTDQLSMKVILCHDDGEDQGALQQWQWMSFPLEDLKPYLGTRKQLSLALTSTYTGYQYIEEVQLP